MTILGKLVGERRNRGVRTDERGEVGAPTRYASTVLSAALFARAITGLDQGRGYAERSWAALL
jgi:hypothetical protein